MLRGLLWCGSSCGHRGRSGRVCETIGEGGGSLGDASRGPAFGPVLSADRNTVIMANLPLARQKSSLSRRTHANLWPRAMLMSWRD